MPKIITSFLLFFLLNSSLYSQNLDIDILRDININRNKNLDNICDIFSNTTSICVIAVPTSIFLTGYFLDNKNIIHNSIIGATGVLGAATITLMSKELIARSRPYEKYQLENIRIEDGYSMPSGHTTIAFATATAISLQFPKWYAIVPSFLWASAVSYSRLHLGLHYPSDILLGAVIGIGSSYLSFYLQKYFREK